MTSTSRPTLYLAGPYSHPDPVANTHRVVRVASILYDTTPWVPIVPHLTLLWHVIDPHPLEHWYQYDLHVMTACAAVTRLPGKSTGADHEMAYAIDNDMTIIAYGALPVAARRMWEAM